MNNQRRHNQRRHNQPHREERFDGRAAEMRKSPWLASEDLDGIGKDVQVVIEDVMRHENAAFDEGRTEAEVFSLKFRGKEKQMILNATNRKTLMRAFGARVGNWRGQTIALYVDPEVRFGKKRVKGLRIRIPESRPMPDHESAGFSDDDLMSEEETWGQTEGGAQ